MLCYVVSTISGNFYEWKLVLHLHNFTFKRLSIKRETSGFTFVNTQLAHRLNLKLPVFKSNHITKTREYGLMHSRYMSIGPHFELIYPLNSQYSGKTLLHASYPRQLMHNEVQRITVQWYVWKYDHHNRIRNKHYCYQQLVDRFDQSNPNNINNQLHKK